MQDSKVARIAAFDNFAATYRFCVYPLDLAIEKLRDNNAIAYPPGVVFLESYTEDELRQAFY